MSAYSGYSDPAAGSDTASAPQRVDATMAKATATEIWNSTFAGATSVTMETFARGMARHFNAAYRLPLYSAATTDAVPCLMNAALAATGALTPASASSPAASITRDAFLLFLSRFGGGLNRLSVRDLPTDAVKNLFDLSPLAHAATTSTSLLGGGSAVDNGNLVSLVSWLHSASDLPPTSAAVDSMILTSAQSSSGSFLLRWSGSRPGQLAMDFVAPLETKVRKLLLERMPEGGWMKGGGKTVHPTLHALVANHAQANGTWIRSEAAKRFQGGDAATAVDGPAGGASGYSTDGLADQLATAHVSNAYAADPITAMPMAIPAATGGYAATFDPVASAPMPAAAPAAASGYSASFVEAISPSHATGVAAAPSTDAPAPPSLLLPLATRALFYACAVGDLCSLEAHFARCEGCAVVDGWGLSLMHVACANEQPEVLKLLRSHVPDSFLRANVTTAISVSDSSQLAAYTWVNRFMPYWPAKVQAHDLDVCNLRALCLEFGGASSACLSLLVGWGVQPTLLLERAPSAKRPPEDQSVPILMHSAGMAPMAAPSGYQAQ